MNADLTALVGQARAARAGEPDAAGQSRERLELERVAQQFEAMLLTQMLREMRRTAEWDGGEEGEGASGLGLGTESFMETIDAELASHLVKVKGLGLAPQLMQGLDRIKGEVPAATAPGSPLAEPVMAPIASQVTSDYGWRSDPFTGRATFHKGIDLRAAYGQDVQAAAGGRVVFSGEQRGYGNTVVVEHADGSRSRYAHLSATSVAAGDQIQAGTPVGRAGHSGRATGTHLHFEVTGPDGSPVSPAEWMQRRALEPLV